METPDRRTPPAVRPFGRLILPGEEKVVLANGLMLHTLSGGDQDVARLSIVAEGGTSDADNPCIASFAAELLREGNSMHDSSQIADLFDYNGAWISSSAASHHTIMRMSALTSRFDAVLADTVACLTEPTLPEDAFEVIRRKGIAQQQINFSRVSFLASADNKRMICGPGHPESRTPSTDEIAAISLDDIRRFQGSNLDAARTHAYLCGRLTPELTDCVARRLGEMPRRDISSPIKIVPFSAMPPATSVTDRPESLQSAVVLSIPAIARTHPDYNFLRLTVTALGGYFGCRLMTNIREDKGYTYGITASLIGSHDGSYITVSAQCDKRYTEALIDEVRNELRGMVTRPLGADELSRLRFNAASDLASTLDSPMNMMDYYELQQTVGTPPGYFDARQDALADITPEIICAISQKYLDPDALRISIAGDINC